MEFYTSQRNSYSTALTSLKKQYNTISTLRLAIAVIAIALGYYGLKQGNFNTYIVPILGCVAVFVYLMKKHADVANKKLRAATLVAINKDEITHLERKGNNFDNGAEYIDFKHSYSYDLDIFGQNSLFQHINRTETYKGKEKLANMLLATLPIDSILQNQEAVKELADKPEWRQEVQALGRMKKDSNTTYSKLMEWCSGTTGAINKISYLFAVIAPLALAGCFITYMITGESSFFNGCIYIFIFNLFMVGGKAKLFKNEISNTTETDEILHQYSLIIAQIEQTEFQSEKLNALKQKLSSEGKPAGQLIKKLATLFGQMDSISNVFAALLFNGFFQYHIHVFRGLQNWKKQHSSAIPVWLDVIAEFEALNSLANLYYNNKDYTFPKLNTNETIIFKELAHPLLNPATRVGNDVIFQPQFTILTGSNMSGKSTFLRSLGVNMVLAGIGAPVCAKEATVHPLPVLVSMRLSDSLSDSESYFFAEIKRLKQIMDALHEKRSFVLLDEILRGTNSDDKRTGTIAVVKKMIAGQAIGAIATHDVEVCNITAEHPEQLINRCFEANIANNNLYFDYKLRDGICKNKSATFLMEKMGVI
ncbi:DNA mismatch repair protein [Flavobacterium salilacus subsp. salilacus]|uniref:MutS-related protein n=1 Tax=Flavobacterium TaxID=237 RepID=UPI0010751058|nr:MULTISPECIES: DNA mismatch repair protein [Flavobacterium]KAF2516310.1 DNA mismatch repair protein [Flavobacterium salilacus subsp. salilacus]MBE1613841.1 DNA mismatch repair protein [Flavobacterium sp. SaA2.13]